MIKLGPGRRARVEMKAYDVNQVHGNSLGGVPIQELYKIFKQSCSKSRRE